MSTKSHSRGTGKLALGIGGIVLLLNSLLIGVSFKQSNQNAKEPNRIEAKFLFNVKQDKVFYQEKEISILEFQQILSNLKTKNIIPEVFFDEATVSNGFYTKIREIVDIQNLFFREVKGNSPKK